MCGATLVSATENLPPLPSQRASRPVPPPAQAAVPPIAPVVTTRPSTPAPQEQPPSTSGSSFLGLNDSASSERPRAGLGIDPGGASSRNLDYLLEDDEEPRGGAGKWILMLVALALAVGFGYMRWKGQDFSWLTSGPKKPAAATTDSSDSSAPSTSPADSSTPSSSTPSSLTPAGSTPSATVPQIPPNAAPANSTASNPPASNPASNRATTATPPATAAATPAATTTGSPAGDGSSNPAAAPSSPAVTSNAPPPAGAKDSTDADSDSSDAAAKPAPAAKPAAVSKPLQPVDAVAEAQKYIYGKGARQDCERGLRLLKPAADQSNSKAMIEMGALYSAGLCTPRDLPTAYRWFALALRKDPNNQSVQDDLQQLWGEMTQPERQLAIRLSQ
jgi:hypothetical protein